MNGIDESTPPKIGAIFGTGRSGSTWVGAVINTHPKIAYRFEPFDRVPNDPAIQKAMQLLKFGDLNDQALDIIYQALLPANPLADQQYGGQGGRGIEFAIERR